MNIGFIISFILVVIPTLIVLFYDINVKNGIIKKLRLELEKEQEFRESREDSLGEVISEELSLPPGKRRLCHGCEFIYACANMTIEFVNGNSVTVPIYDQFISNMLMNCNVKAVRTTDDKVHYPMSQENDSSMG